MLLHPTHLTPLIVVIVRGIIRNFYDYDKGPRVSQSEWARLVALQLDRASFGCPKCRGGLRAEYQFVPGEGQSIILRCPNCGFFKHLWVHGHGDAAEWLVKGLQSVTDSGLVDVPHLQAVQASLDAF